MPWTTIVLQWKELLMCYEYDAFPYIICFFFSYVIVLIFIISFLYVFFYLPNKVI
jgi:hypothetical protein